MKIKDFIKALEYYFQDEMEEEIEISELGEALLFEEPNTYDEVIETLEENLI